MKYIIEAENIVKFYGRQQAVKGFSFKISKGECYDFLGHNGAGKSTTMRMLYGLSSVESGSLKLFGEKIRLTPSDIKKKIGVMPQEDNLDIDLTVKHNLEVYGRFFGLSSKETTAKAQELLKFMGLEEKSNAEVESLSGGLKRRLVIARALLNSPQILILDEPTTGLDPQARRIVWQKLRKLKEEGVTLILTTHYMEEAAQLCDRLAIMDEGKILDEASPAELVEKHVLPYVVEIRLSIEQVPNDIREKAAKVGGTIERFANGLYIYTKNGQEIWRHLESWGISQLACSLRPTHLEDVYLKLTGRIFADG